MTDSEESGDQEDVPTTDYTTRLGVKLQDHVESMDRSEIPMDRLCWDEEGVLGQQRKLCFARVAEMRLSLHQVPLQQRLEPLLWRSNEGIAPGLIFVVCRREVVCVGAPAYYGRTGRRAPHRHHRQAQAAALRRIRCRPHPAGQHAPPHQASFGGRRQHADAQHPEAQRVRPRVEGDRGRQGGGGVRRQGRRSGRRAPVRPGGDHPAGPADGIMQENGEEESCRDGTPCPVTYHSPIFFGFAEFGHHRILRTSWPSATTKGSP